MRVRSPVLRAGAAIVALLILLAVLGPALLFGDLVSPVELLVVAAAIVGLGLLLLRGSGTIARVVGLIVLILGIVLLALVVLLIAAVNAGWGRGY